MVDGKVGIGRLAQTFLFRSALTKLDTLFDPVHFQQRAVSQKVEPPASPGPIYRLRFQDCRLTIEKLRALRCLNSFISGVATAGQGWKSR
jgi:hypothetical protein